MRLIINRVKLQNIRSHVDSEICFTEGFNCVVGGVGAGKTSILLAIHFALFGEPLYRTYEYLLREDRTYGRVELEFEHLGKTYKIIRALTRDKSGRIVQNPNELVLLEDGKKVAWERVSSVQKYLQEVVGIDRRLFESFIWIQQERLKDVLNWLPSERQRILDELFGLSMFQKAWENLHAYHKKYRGNLESLEEDPDLKQLPGLIKERDELLSESMRLQVELESTKVELEEARRKFQVIEEKFRELEELGREAEKLKEEEENLKIRLSEVEGEIRRLKAEIEDKKKNISQIGKRIEKIEFQKEESLCLLRDKLKLEVSTLEDVPPIYEELKAEREWVKDRISELKVSVLKAEEALNAVRGEKTCPTCKQPIDEEYKEILLAQLKMEIEDGVKEAEKLKLKLSELNGKITALEEIRVNYEKLKLEKETLESQIAEVKSYIEKAESKIKELKEDAEKLKEALRKAQEKISRFKVEELERLRREREEALLKIKGLEGDIKRFEELAKEKTSALEKLEERIERAEAKSRRLEKLRRILRIIEDLRSAYRDIIPALRRTYIEELKYAIQSVIDSLTASAGRSLEVEIDEEYTPILREEASFRRSSNVISGGERTWLSLAYKIGLGQLIFESRTGRNLELLILDEPTEALGTEDGSINALASAITNLKAIRQIIAVTHSEELASSAINRILVEKQRGISKVKTF